MKNNRVWGARSGFSLVELLVVIAIIALVVSLVLPALGKVRDATRGADTKNLLSNLNGAMQQFTQDNKRSPGYFTPSEMGGADNAARGFSVGQNVMIDLLGGPTTQTGADVVSVGPMNDATRRVNVAVGTLGSEVQSGTGINKAKAYFAPSDRFFKRQDAALARHGVVEHTALPDLVDAWGTPILIWSVDTGAVSDVGQVADFAKEAWAPNSVPARFYWNSNIAFLKNGLRVGAKSVDQGNQSLLGEGVSTNDRAINMTGLLGNPASPMPDTTANPPLAAFLPKAPRGSYVLQSGGRDGAYLGRTDRGGRRANGRLYYGFNFKANDATWLTDSNGNRTSSDLLNDFDDITESAN